MNLIGFVMNPTAAYLDPAATSMILTAIAIIPVSILVFVLVRVIRSNTKKRKKVKAFKIGNFIIVHSKK